MAFIAGYGTQDAVLPIGLASGLVELAQQQQLDVEKLLRGTRLFYDDLIDPARLVSLAQWLMLIERLTKQHAEPDAVALLYGQQQALTHHQLLTAIWSCADNLAQALRLMARLTPMLHLPLVVRVRLRTDELVLQLQPTTALSAEQRRFVVSAALAAMRTLLREQLGNQQLLKMDLPWSQLHRQPHFHAVLGEQLRFDAPCSAIYLRKECLFMPFAGASRLRRQQLLTTALALRPQGIPRLSLQAQLRRLCHRHLQSGVTLEQAALYLGCSPATLKRRLKSDGVSFQQLQDEVRREEVLTRLDIYGYNNRQLAECLNISDMHNFRRVFKRWTGVVPSSFR